MSVSIRKIGSSWPVLWLLWVVITGLGWVGTAFTIAAISFSSGIWDPDEVESYLSGSPLTTLISSLITGAMIGIVLGTLFGLFQQQALHRTWRYALVTVTVTMIGTAILCASASSTGPAQVQSDLAILRRAALTGGILGGVFCGICQWLLLSLRLPGLDRWPLMTTTGWAIGWAAVLWLPASLPGGSSAAGPIWPLMIVLATGVIAGLLQWVLLRRELRRAGWWILATAGGWGLAYEFGQIQGLKGLGFAVIGVLPATALVLLLRQLKPEAPPEGAPTA